MKCVCLVLRELNHEIVLMKAQQCYEDDELALIEVSHASVSVVETISPLLVTGAHEPPKAAKERPTA